MQIYLHISPKFIRSMRLYESILCGKRESENLRMILAGKLLLEKSTKMWNSSWMEEKGMQTYKYLYKELCALHIYLKWRMKKKTRQSVVIYEFTLKDFFGMRKDWQSVNNTLLNTVSISYVRTNTSKSIWNFGERVAMVKRLVVIFVCKFFCIFHCNWNRKNQNRNSVMSIKWIFRFRAKKNYFDWLYDHKNKHFIAVSMKNETAIEKVVWFYFSTRFSALHFNWLVSTDPLRIRNSHCKSFDSSQFSWKLI